MNGYTTPNTLKEILSESLFMDSVAQEIINLSFFLDLPIDSFQ